MDVFKVTPEMNEAWCAYEPAGQFAEAMSFARFNGMLRHAFMCGFKSAQGTPTRSAETTGSVGEADGGPVAEPCAQSSSAPAHYGQAPTAQVIGDSLCGKADHE